MDVAELLATIRGPWGVENGLHRTLDVQLREDGGRLRRAVLNMVRTFQQPFKSDVSIGLLRVRGSDPRVELQPLVVRLVRRLEAALEADAESEAKEEAELAETCAVDGKTVRASGDADRGVLCPRIVLARLASGLVVGRTSVPDKSNELTAHPPTGRPRRVHRCPGLPDGHRRDHRRRGRRGTCWPSRTTSPTCTPTGNATSPTWTAPHGPCATAPPTCPWTPEPHRWPSWCAATGGHPPGAGTACTGCRTDTQEDRCRLRTGLAARNRAALRRIALNFLMILTRSFWPRMSIRRMRKMVVRNSARREPIMAL